MRKLLRSIRSLFQRKAPQRGPVRPKPSWPEIVELMYDKGLSFPAYDVVKVVYSPDKKGRLVLLKSQNYGFYKYEFQYIDSFIEDEWEYVSDIPGALPAIWMGFGCSSRSFFGTTQEAWNEAISSREYKYIFEGSPQP